MSSPRKTDAHRLTTHDAAKRFEELGVPRSQRSIERYCKRGDLDAWVDPDFQTYYVTLESVDRLAGHFKEIDARRGQQGLPLLSPVGDVGRQAPPLADERRQSEKAAEDSEEVSRMRRELEDLQRANRDLEINSRVKDAMLENAKNEIERQVSERQFLVGKIEEANRMLGAAEAQLKALQAPADHSRQEPSRPPEPEDPPHYGSH